MQSLSNLQEQYCKWQRKFDVLRYTLIQHFAHYSRHECPNQEKIFLQGLNYGPTNHMHIV